MQRNQRVVVSLMAALAASACADAPTSPTRIAPTAAAAHQNERGTGLVLQSVTGLTLPLIGSLGDVVIDQTNLTHLTLVENVIGQIVGVQANGVLQLTGGVLGTDVITEDFLTEVHIASSGPGQCSVVTVDLGPITLDALGSGISVDIPQATVNPLASGAVGPLLCSLGQALQPPVSLLTSTVRALVNVINAILI